MTAHLGEVSDQVAARIIVHRQHVEMKRLHVVVECLVVEEQFGQKTQVLTVDLRLVAVHLKRRQVATSVYLVARRTTQVTFLLATQIDIHVLHHFIMCEYWFHHLSARVWCCNRQLKTSR